LALDEYITGSLFAEPRVVTKITGVCDARRELRFRLQLLYRRRALLVS